ncbi:class I SAM-dependent methyltransferase [soil metagenome]
MQISTDNYFLDVGEEGKNRLEILNEVFSGFSSSFLLNAGISKGKSVLEIGCGTGHLTCWIAEQVGSSGQVYALDTSDEQLKIAKQHAVEKGLTNIIFIQSSILDLLNLTELPLVDIVYARFILVFLHNPLQALEHMLQSLKVGGKIICEEACNSVTYCYPFSPSIHKSRQLFLELAKKKGLDFDLGEKLYSYFYKLNLKNINAQFVQPIYHTKRQKLLIPLTFKEACDSYVTHSLADISETKQLIADLYKCIEDNSYIMSFPRTTQIYGQKQL